MPTKSANNAIELNYINFIPSNTSINFTASVTNNGSPIADATAGSYANSAYAQANTSGVTAQAAFDQANNAFTQSNGAYATANNALAAANNSGGVASLTNILMLAGM
jgi:predicted butyrate kinase (DUF1464 family)